MLSVIEFDTEAEAVALANDTPYGLAASLYTHDLDRAHRVARDLKAGVVGVNAYSEGDMTTPFGGYKLSGFGGHDKSRPCPRPVHRDQDDLDPAPTGVMRPVGPTLRHDRSKGHSKSIDSTICWIVA